MLISSFCAYRTNAVILNGVTLQNASVNADSLGCTTAGGFIGMIGFNTQFKNEARFIDCTYENLTLRGDKGNCQQYQGCGADGRRYPDDSPLLHEN